MDAVQKLVGSVAWGEGIIVPDRFGRRETRARLKSILELVSLGACRRCLASPTSGAEIEPNSGGVVRVDC